MEFTSKQINTAKEVISWSGIDYAHYINNDRYRQIMLDLKTSTLELNELFNKVGEENRKPNKLEILFSLINNDIDKVMGEDKTQFVIINTLEKTITRYILNPRGYIRTKTLGLKDFGNTVLGSEKNIIDSASRKNHFI